MNVFLVHASAYFPETERSMPLGAMYLASYLKDRHQCRVKLFDMQLRVRTPEPVIFQAREFKPDLIGISAMTPDSKVMESLAARFKSEFPDLPIVSGGAHASNNPESVMKNPSVDYVVSMEGERGFGALVDHLNGKRDLEQVPNLYYRRNGSSQQNDPAEFIEDLDSLPFPAYDLIDLEAYYRIPRCGVILSRQRYAALMTSRGCPYRCAYCHQILGKKWRPRSPENVVDEIEWLANEYGIGEFLFMDDIFNLSTDRTNRIARLIIDRELDVGLSFPIGLRGDIMTEESVKLLKQAGMFRCMYAVESASERIQGMIRKDNKLDKLLHIIDYTRKLGIMVHGSFMLGFPTETEQEAHSTIEWALRSGLHTAAFYRVIPFKGSELYVLAKAAGTPIPEDPKSYEFHKSTAVNVSAMPNRVLNRLKRKAYRRFYLSPRRLWDILRVLPNRRKTLPALLLIWIRKALLW